MREILTVYMIFGLNSGKKTLPEVIFSVLVRTQGVRDDARSMESESYQEISVLS